MKRFYEMGGIVTKVNEPIPPWTELGNTWNEEDGESWDVEPCHSGGRSVYAGNIYCDPMIRGHTNPDFDLAKYWEIMRKKRAEECE